MSTNIIKTDARGELRIAVRSVCGLLEQLLKRLPEDNFLSRLSSVAMDIERSPDEQLRLINEFAWQSTWSGHSYIDGTLEQVAQHLLGQADGCFTGRMANPLACALKTAR